MPLEELAWVDYLRKKVKKGKGVVVGIGDDCSLVKIGKENLLLKSDLFIEDIHFDRKKISFRDIGARAVARVLSDFAACCGVPKFIGASIGVPSYVKSKNLKEILKGILEYSKKYNFSLIGGDTSCAKKLFLDIWGVAVTKKCILRSTAKTGDYIFVTGKLGERGFNRPFEPRIKEAVWLAKNSKVNAMIDISDGFIIDLYRILDLSKKGAIICRDSIPCAEGDKSLLRGEDYELIFTIDKSEKKIEALKNKFYFVGEIKPFSFGYKLKVGNKLQKVKVKGYTHF